MAIQLHSLDPTSRTVTATTLPLDGLDSFCTVRLRALPGAQCIHILLQSDDGVPSLRAEIDADPGDAVPVAITRQADNTLAVSSTRKVLLFPPDSRFEPPRLLRPPKDGKLDLLFLFDATARIFGDQVNTKSKEAKAGPPEPRKLVTWQAHLDRILEFSKQMRQIYADTRVACAAFGDLPMKEHAGVEDLMCRYVFRPEEDSHRWLEPISQQQLRDEFNGLEYTPGGDFVDALAEALESCQNAGWRQDSRKLLLISGDSPGNAVIDPAPPGSDARVRRVDVHLEALHLHEQHEVEILTVYLESNLAFDDAAHRFVDYARHQYKSLATLRTLAWTSESFDPAMAAAEAQKAAEEPGIALRRGYGVLDSVEPVAAGSA